MGVDLQAFLNFTRKTGEITSWLQMRNMSLKDYKLAVALEPAYGRATEPGPAMLVTNHATF